MTANFDIIQISENKHQIRKRRKRIIDSCGNPRVVPELSSIKLNIIDSGNWLGMMIFSLQWNGQFFDFRMNRYQVARIKNGNVFIYNNIFKYRVASYFASMIYGCDKIDTVKYIYNCWKNNSAWDEKFEEMVKLLARN